MEAADENGGDKRCNCGNNPVTSAPRDNRTARVAPYRHHRQGRRVTS
jgi:hypothetical protein